MLDKQSADCTLIILKKMGAGHDTSETFSKNTWMDNTIANENSIATDTI